MDTAVLSVAVLVSAATFGLLAVFPEALPVVTFLWQWVTIFASVGALLAYRRKRRNPTADPFILITRWSVCGLAVGLMLVVPAVLS